MATKRLTQRSVDALKTGRKQEDFMDTAVHLRGISFGIRVTDKGLKEYFCRYRDRQKQRRRLVLGDACKISLREAHQKLREVAARLDQGIDASEERDASNSAITFRTLCQEYVRLHASLKKDGGKEDARIIERTLLPAWGAMKASDVRRRNIACLLDEIGTIQKKPVAANRTRAVISSIFSFALRRELVEVTPCVGLPKKFPEQSRARFLSDEEILWFWQSTGAEAPVVRDIFRLLLLVGQRSGETKAMEWSHLSQGVWHIPPTLTKNKKEQVVPLPAYVVSLLEKHRPNGHSGVFVARGDSSIEAIQKAKCRIAERMCKIAAKAIPNWTAHDLRRTCSSGMEQLGIPDPVITTVMNHSKSSRQGVTAVYARYPYLKEKGNALEQWCNYVLRLVAVIEKPTIDLGANSPKSVGIPWKVARPKFDQTQLPADCLASTNASARI